MKKLFPSLQYMNIPNAITVTSSVIGLISLSLIATGKWQVGMGLYAVTFLCDDLDGFIARKLNQQSEFGKQLDSLGDFCNFCFIPGMIFYELTKGQLRYLPVMGIFLLGGILRLAYFNLNEMVIKEGGQFFTGMPTTMAAAYFYVLISLALKWQLLNHIILAICMATGGLLMCSGIPVKKHGILTKALYIVIPIGFILNII